MEIDISHAERSSLIAGAVVLLVLVAAGIGLLGRAVTPVRAGAPGGRVVLTPARWKAAELARQARAETDELQNDAAALRALIEVEERPDPVEAMLLAERIYANHRSGTGATGRARNALIAAAETAAQYASGATPRQEAITALNTATERIKVLTKEYDDTNDTANGAE